MIKSRFFIPELDSLRFIAFILIFIHHQGVTHIYLLDHIKNIGWIGVDIFFCLSAFLLTRLLFCEQEEIGSVHIWNFFMRRVLRIWPLYFAYVSIAIIFSWYEGIVKTESWFRLTGLLTFTDNIFASYEGYNPIRFTGHLWTISYEEQFYLLLPFIVRYLAGKTAFKINLFLGICFLIGSLIRLFFIYAHARHPAIWVLPITHFESVLIGVLLGFKSIKVDAISPGVYLLIALASITAIVVLPGTAVTSYHLMLLYPCIGVASGSILCFVLYVKSKPIKKLLSTKPLVFFGKISFGLYVFHNFCISFMAYILQDTGVTTFNFIGSLVLTITIASLSYFFLERRFLVMKSTFSIIPSRPI